jgi:hypothetical protein
MLNASVEAIAPPEVLSALARLGQTECVRFSPTGRRLAIAGFGRNVVYVLDIEVASTDTDLSVTLTGFTEISCASLQDPHGLCFLDEDTLAVANRLAEVPILRLPQAVPGVRSLDVAPLQTLRADDVHGLKSPGSVMASRLAPDVFELLVCNSYADNVSRHVVDARDGYRVLSSEVLVRQSIELPDGVALSDDRRWLAVNNHNTHNVLLYRYTASLGPDTPPDGVLENINYPHGVCFTADGGHVVVSDAGAPYVYAFARGADDWNGVRQPVATNRIMDDESFLRGRYNHQEGGPKGLDLDPTMRVVVVSSWFLPLAFFDARQLVPGIGEAPRPSPIGNEGDGEAIRGSFIRAFHVAADNADTATALESTLADRDSRVVELEEIVAGLNDQVAQLERAVVDRDALCAQTAAELEARAAGLESGFAAELDAIRADLHEARVAGDYHRRAAVDRDAQLQALRSSTSWRITAIPRWILGHTLRRR